MDFLASIRRSPRRLVLFRYIAREYIFSFFVAFLFFFILFFVNQMLVIAQQVLSKQVDLFSTIKLIVYAMPTIIALAFPFGSLVGALMAIGRFSSDNEITAMQACGISLLWIFLPILLIALIASGVSFVMNDYFLPIGNIKYVQLYQDLVYSNSNLILEPYSVTRYKDSVIITGPVSQGKFEQVLILDNDEKGQERVISARQGRLVRNDQQAGIISLDLDNVFVFDLSKNRVDFDFSKSNSITYNMLFKNLSYDVRNPSPREMSSTDVLDQIRHFESDLAIRSDTRDRDLRLREWTFTDKYSSLVEDGVGGKAAFDLLNPTERDIRTQLEQPLTDRNLQIYWIEYWKKFSIPAACFTFIFLGFPLGMFAKRSGRSIGFGLGFVIAVVFWGMLLAGQSIGTDNPSLSPFILMWAPNILFFVIGIFLFARRILR